MATFALNGLQGCTKINAATNVILSRFLVFKFDSCMFMNVNEICFAL